MAAINRAQLAITDYPGVPASKEALQILVKSYDALGMKDLKADSQRVLEKNYPETANSPAKKSSAWWQFW